MNKKYLVIIEYETNKVVKHFDLLNKSEREIEKFQRGIDSRIDGDKFYSLIVDESQNQSNLMNSLIDQIKKSQ